MSADMPKLNMNKLSAKVETERLQDLFCRNVFLFLQNADIILADPQMAYCAVPFKCGTAQSGSFPCLTLGVYLEWWQTSKDATHVSDDGRKALTYYFAGSLLSGVNNSSRVYEDGTTEHFNYNKFADICRSFLSISKKYCNGKRDVVPYSLDEVTDRLSSLTYKDKR